MKSSWRLPAKWRRRKPAGAGRLAAGQIVHAMSVIHAEPQVEALLKSLLGRTFIASDLGTATAQIQNGHAGCDFVTLGGELLNRHGIYTGGYLNKGSNGKAPASILGRKNQITELQANWPNLQKLVEDASRKRGELLSEQTELQASLQQAQTELRVAGSRHRHARRRVQGAAKFQPLAAPEN